MDNLNFGHLLQVAREHDGLSRAELARRVGLDTSYLYRLETSDRTPSREAVVVLADALGVHGDELNAWLRAAGYSAQPILAAVRGPVRTSGIVHTRGAIRPPDSNHDDATVWDSARWMRALELLGLYPAAIERVVRALDASHHPGRHGLARSIGTAVGRVAASLEAPLQSAVIPVAGGQHRLLAPQVIQRLLLTAMREALEAGLTTMILVISPGMGDVLYTPLREALELMLIPQAELMVVEQPAPVGLGDAVLRAEQLVGDQPFAVLLPDDLVRPRGRVAAPQSGLQRMLEIFQQVGFANPSAQLLAVATERKRALMRGGVISPGVATNLPGVIEVAELIEQPGSDHPLSQASDGLAIIGRYILQPPIFDALRESRSPEGPLHLTSALDLLRRRGAPIYAYRLEGTRQHLGDAIDQANLLLKELE